MTGARPERPQAVPVAAPARRRGGVLALVARFVSWPLVSAFLLLGFVLRLLEDLARLLRFGFGERGWGEGEQRLQLFTRQAVRYLTFRSDVIPPLVGVVHEAEGSTPGPWMEAKRRLRRDRVAMASWIGICLYVYVAVFAAVGLLAADFDRMDTAADYRPPTLAVTASGLQLGAHPLGTDLFGREVWKMTVQGTKNALWIGTLAAGMACVIGLVLGAIAGYFGGWIDEIIVWAYTTLASIPYLLLMLALSFAFKSNPTIQDWYDETFLKTDLGLSLGLFTIVIAVGFTFWVSVARVVRGEFIKLRDLEYVTAAKSLGVPTRRVIFRHLAPNVFHLVLISFSLLFMSAIKFEVILSFLGVGMEAGEASWGQMISNAKLELMRADSVWWQIAAATAAMFGLLLSVNLFSDALRDALDPRLRD